jgi:hypothetical protein
MTMLRVCLILASILFSFSLHAKLTVKDTTDLIANVDKKALLEAQFFKAPGPDFSGLGSRLVAAEGALPITKHADLSKLSTLKVDMQKLIKDINNTEIPASSVSKGWQAKFKGFEGSAATMGKKYLKASTDQNEKLLLTIAQTLEAVSQRAQHQLSIKYPTNAVAKDAAPETGRARSNALTPPRPTKPQ